MTRPVQILLTETEAAAALRICARVLRKARQDGLLHYVLIGRSVRYTQDDLESYVARQRKVEPPCPATTTRTTKARRAHTAGAVIVPFHQRKLKASGGERL